MKNTRFMSLLLSCALAFGALPMIPAASAAEAELAVGDNVLGKATRTAGAAVTSFTDASESGDGAYLHVYNRNDRWSGLRWYLGELDPGTYYVSFDARLPFENEYPDDKNTRMNGYGESGNWGHWYPIGDADYGIKLMPNWQHFDASLEVPSNVAELGDGEVHFALLGYTWGGWHHPYDIDNLKVYTKNADGTPNEPLFTADFDTPITVGTNPGEFSAYKRNGGTAGVDFDVTTPEDFERVAGNTVDNTFVTYTFDNYELPAGVYDLVGDLRYADYDYDLSALSPDNSANVTVTATIDGDTLTLASGKITTEWSALEADPLIFHESVTLTEVKITTDKKNPIDFKNVALTLTDGLTDAVTAAGENLLTGSLTASNRVTVADENVTDALGNSVEANGYLRVANIPNSAMELIRIDSSYLPEMGKPYYVAFDVRTVNEDETTSIRAYGNSKSQEVVDVPRMNKNYLKPTANNEFEYALDTGAGGWYMTGEMITSEWKHFEGQYTPVADPKNGIVITLYDGPSNNPKSFDIDNFEIYYYGAGGQKVTAYSDNFEGETAGERVSVRTSGITKSIITEVAATVSTVEASADNPAKLTYDLDGVLSDSRYHFAIDLRAADGGTATVSYTLKNGTTKTLTTAELGANWVTASGVIRLDDGERLTSITVLTDVTTALSFKDAELVSQVRPVDKGMPNRGIVMMMLLKKNGGSIRPVKTELVSDDLEGEVIIKEVGSTAQSAADAGWYAKIDESKSTKLELVKENDNSFIRVRDLDKGQRGIYYNSGVMLDAGTYTLSVDLRVSEAETDANYTAYTWHGTAGSYQEMRVNITDASNINSPGYGARNGVDKDTFYDVDGTTVGWGKKITDEWTTYTDTIVLDKPTLAVFKIGGYTGGASDSHGFDIDNFSIIGYVTPNAGADGT